MSPAPITTIRMHERSVPADLIISGENDREDFNPAYIADLAENIRVNGLAQRPVYRLLRDGNYQIVLGECRTRAMRDVLGMKQIPANVAVMTDEQASALMLAENSVRRNLNPIEEAKGFQKRMGRFGWSEAKVAERAGRTPDLVKRRLLLLRLRPDVQHLIKSGQFPLGHAEAMAELDANRQLIALKAYNERGLPLRAFREVVSRLLTDQQQESLFNLDSLTLQSVTAEVPPATSGWGVAIDLPTTRRNPSPALPAVRYKRHDLVGTLLERYIADLQGAGEMVAAEAVANVYATLLAHNWTRRDFPPYLPQQHEMPIRDLLHEKRID